MSDHQKTKAMQPYQTGVWNPAAKLHPKPFATKLGEARSHLQLQTRVTLLHKGKHCHHSKKLLAGTIPHRHKPLCQHSIGH
jgi:hypothetical protein